MTYVHNYPSSSTQVHMVAQFFNVYIWLGIQISYMYNICSIYYFSLSAYNRITNWLKSHTSGGMLYNDGYLYVAYDGYYYIYSQMYYYAGDTVAMAHRMKINDHIVLTGHSSASSTNKYNTNYIGGVFKLTKGQKISVSAPFTNIYYFHKHEAYFGAFLLHV